MLVSVSDLRTYMDVSLTNRQIDAAEFVLRGLQSEMETYLGRPIEVAEVTEEYTVSSSAYALPESSFFYEGDRSTTQSMVVHAVPGVHLPLRKSPVVSVSSVFLSSMSSQMYLGEAAQKNANISAATSTSTLITYTTTAAHKITIGQRVSLSNVTPVNYNFTASEVLEVTSTTFKIKNQTGAVLPSYVSGGSALAVGTGYIVHRWGLEIFGGIPNDILTVTYAGGLNGDNIATMKLMILRAATREMQNMHDDVVGVKDLNPRSVAVAETGFLEKELSVLKSFRRRRIS